MLKKKPVGFAIMDLRQLVIVWRMGKPLDAFSIMALYMLRNTVRSSSLGNLFRAISEKSHRSIIVISGHVSAPAEAALTTSTPSRKPRSRVFHVGATARAGTTFGHGAGGVGCATGRSETVAMAKEASCATASRVILIWRMRDRRVPKISRRGA